MGKMDQKTTIKILLLKKGILQKDIVDKYPRLYRSTLCDVIAGKRKTRWIQKVLAKELGVKVSEIFNGGRGRYGRG